MLVFRLKIQRGFARVKRTTTRTTQAYLSHGSSNKLLTRFGCVLDEGTIVRVLRDTLKGGVFTSLGSVSFAALRYVGQFTPISKLRKISLNPESFLGSSLNHRWDFLFRASFD